MLFAPALFVVARLLGRRDRRLEATFAILVILVVAALRFSISPHDWDLNVRRVTLFRIDSIVWGFLLYLALERRPPLALNDASGRWRSGRAPRAACGFDPGRARRRDLGHWRRRSAQQAFPYVSAAFGMISVGVFWRADGLFRSRIVRGASFYLGRVSYSVYLFHLIIIMALKPMIAATPLALQLAIYVLAILALSTVFFAGFERPILAARPYYGAARRAAAAIVAPLGEARRSRSSLLTVALAIAAIAAGALARNAFMADKPYAFYPLLAATAVLALALAGRARPLSTGAVAVAARAFLLFALALPFADALYRRSTGLPLVATIAAADLFLSRRARQSDCVRDLVVLLSQRVDPGRRNKSGDRCARPAKEAAVRPRSRQFGAHVRHHDPHQQSRLSRAGLAARQRRRLSHCRAWRVADFRAHAARWREAMAGIAAGSVRPHASCGRKIEVINAGTEAYTLEDNLERMRRDILPLKPDLILSTHGMNGFLRVRLETRPGAQRAGRQAPGLGAHRPRGADDRARGARLARPEFGSSSTRCARADV